MNRFITGGAGFIGVNLARHLLDEGNDVVIFDNFSRKGSKDNVIQLQSEYPNVRVVHGDVRSDFDLLCQEINSGVKIVYHLASQVAVTTSVDDPKSDFEINALGSVNVLEAARRAEEPPVVFYASTNKVYGGMEEIDIIEGQQRYKYKDYPDGISELHQLDFHSPYGCSKGAADQYFRDYFRIYGLRTVVFRQSCIYGIHQYGIEDQGWVAWFSIAAVLRKKISVYGDGKQVRDILDVRDLIRAFDMAMQQIEVTAGQIYNIGGGCNNVMSLLDLLDYLTLKLDHDLSHKYCDWRPGDQKVFVSNCAKAYSDFGWEPKIRPLDGVSDLVDWVLENRDTIENTLS